jgi:hypothetical protein
MSQRGSRVGSGRRPDSHRPGSRGRPERLRQTRCRLLGAQIEAHDSVAHRHQNPRQDCTPVPDSTHRVPSSRFHGAARSKPSEQTPTSCHHPARGGDWQGGASAIHGIEPGENTVGKTPGVFEVWIGTGGFACGTAPPCLGDPPGGLKGLEVWIGPGGFEPPPPVPKTGVLPLDDGPEARLRLEPG